MAGMKGILKTGNKYDSISHNHLDYIREYRIWGCMINRCTNPQLLHLKRTTVAENIRLRHMSPEDALVKGLRLKYKEAVSCVR